MTKIAVKGNLENALKRFKVKCSRDGIPAEVKKKKFYEKPGVIRREERKKNIKNSRKRSNYE